MEALLQLSPAEATAVRLSLRVAFWAMTTSLIPGILMALVLARGRFWGRTVLDGVVHLPLVMPPVVTGYLLLLLLGRRGPVGQFLDEHLGIVFAFRWTGAALACAVMGFPLMVRAIRLSIEAVDRRLEDAARTLGPGPIWIFLVVTLPLTLPGIIAGMILSFARSMGEFGATITFVSNIPGETQTLPSAIYTLTQSTWRGGWRSTVDADFDRNLDARIAGRGISCKEAEPRGSGELADDSFGRHGSAMRFRSECLRRLEIAVRTTKYEQRPRHFCYLSRDANR